LLYELPKSDFKWSEKITLYSFKNDEFFIFDGLNGLFQLSQNKIVPIPIDKVEFGEKEAQTLNFFKEDKQGRKWLSVYNMLGVYQLNQTKKQFQLFSTPIKNGFIPRMWEDEKGNLLFGQSKTLFHPVYNHFYLLDNKGKWLDLSYFKDLGQFIVDIDSKNFIETTFFATVSGFKVAVNKSSIVKKLLTFQEEEQQVTIRGMAAIDKETVIIANEDNAWYTLNRKTDSIREVKIKEVNSGEIIELNCGNQLFFDKATKALYGVICNKPGNYNSSYFLKVNPTNWTAEKFYFPKRIRSFCQLENGVFWLICANNTSDSQLYSFDPATNQIQFFTTSEEQNPLGDGMPTFLQKSKFGHLWLGTMAGLYAIDLIEKTVDFYNQDSILSGNQVQVLLELEDKKVLIGTNNGVIPQIF